MSEHTRETVRDEVRAWLAEHWQPDRSLREWRTLLASSGWAAPSWPQHRHGRGLPAWADDVVADELARAGAVGTPSGAGTGLAAPTILAHGDPGVQDLLLLPILTGEISWCQLFSEPGSGSDLAGLSTTATRDGDEWVVTGQKLWTTSAHHADLGLLLARTDWSVPKHRGITCFALPMHQSAVEVRPLAQMNGHASFNEVFIADARVPDAYRIGEPGEGWRVALTTLAHERRYGAMRRRRLDRGAGRAVAEAAAEDDDYFRVYEWYPQRAGRADLLSPLAVELGTVDDPVARQQRAGVEALRRSQEWTAKRAQAARALGRAPGAEGSIGKLGLSLVARASASAHGHAAGALGMLTGPDTPAHGMLAEVLVSVPAQSIAGGTDEIQHNILGEQMLGLPREPAPDRDLPYRDVRRS